MQSFLSDKFGVNTGLRVRFRSWLFGQVIFKPLTARSIFRKYIPLDKVCSIRTCGCSSRVQTMILHFFYQKFLSGSYNRISIYLSKSLKVFRNYLDKLQVILASL